MNPLLIVALVIGGTVICCFYPYYFENKYVCEYGGNGLSYLFAGMLGISSFWFVLEVDNADTWKYSAAITLLIISAALNLYWIYKELQQTEASTRYKIQFTICQILFSVGVFGILLIIFLALYLKDTNSRKRKK